MKPESTLTDMNTREAVAEWFGCHVGTVDRWIRDRRLAVVYLTPPRERIVIRKGVPVRVVSGGHVRITRQAVEAFIATNSTSVVMAEGKR